MNNLEKLRITAKAQANRAGLPVAIYNFNRFKPLYVIRDYCPKHAAISPEFVERVDPDQPTLLAQANTAADLARRQGRLSSVAIELYRLTAQPKD